MIRLTRPVIGDSERAAVDAVLASGMLVQGEQVAAFEARLAALCGRRHAVAVASGTTALELALEVLGIGPGDEVLVPALTWPSPAHAVLRRGAVPVLVDVDPHEWNATEAGFAAVRTARTRLAVVIDQFGNPARARAIEGALDGVPILEDAACALGSHFPGAPCGSLGPIACMSFHPRKIVTTGEGGACLLDDDALAERLRVLRNHGQQAPGREAAGNHRMTELAAALGLAQLDRLDAIIAARRERAARYRDALPMLSFQAVPEGARSTYQTLGVRLRTTRTGAAAARERDDVVQALRARGVEAGLLSYALHRVGTIPGPHGPLPGTEAVADTGLALPLFPALTERDQRTVIDQVREVLA